MSVLSQPTPGLLFGSFLYNIDKVQEETLLKLWQKKYGVEHQFFAQFNPLFDYYSKEMGSNLARFFVFHNRLVHRNEMIDAKMWATLLENKHSENDSRIFNLDIGLLTQENFILATGKPYSHRVYISDGIYADLTYEYKNKTYVPLPWTYPDYQHPEKINYFNEVRKFI